LVGKGVLACKKIQQSHKFFLDDLREPGQSWSLQNRKIDWLNKSRRVLVVVAAVVVAAAVAVAAAAAVVVVKIDMIPQAFGMVCL